MYYFDKRFWSKDFKKRLKMKTKCENKSNSINTGKHVNIDAPIPGPLSPLMSWLLGKVINETSLTLSRSLLGPGASGMGFPSHAPILPKWLPGTRTFSIISHFYPFSDSREEFGFYSFDLGPSLGTSLHIHCGSYCSCSRRKPILLNRTQWP